MLAGEDIVLFYNGKGYAYPVLGRLVGLEGKVRGDRRKLLAMAGC